MPEAHEYVEEVFVKEPDEKKEDKKPDIKSVEDISSHEDELSPAEQRAMKDGWRPKEEWSGEADKWVDAKEFNYRGELMKRISSQSDLIHSLQGDTKEMKEALAVLGQHNKEIADKAYDKAIADLKRQRLQAKQNEDFETEIAVEDKIEELKEAKQTADSTEADSTPKEEKKEERKLPQEVQTWLDDSTNDWYNTDAVLRGAADGMAETYMNLHPNDFKGMLEYVDKEMPKRFPTDFNITEENTSSAVTEPSGRAASQKKAKGKQKAYKETDMSDEQRRIGKTFVDTGAFGSIQEYIDQLADLGELPSQQS